jgi:hypothetical protein
LKNDHEQLIKAFSISELSDTWIAISYNGEGIWVSSPKISGDIKIITGKDKKGKDVVVTGKLVTKRGYEGLGIINFPKLSINNILQYIKDEIREVGNIVIASGRLASRGINFTSTDYKWHLTHQVLYMSKMSTNQDLVQSIRLCGCYNDDIPLTLFTSQGDINNLITAGPLQRILIDGCKEIGGSTSECVQLVEVDVKYVNKKKDEMRYETKKTVYHFNLVVSEGESESESTEEKMSEGFLSYSNNLEEKMYNDVRLVMNDTTEWISRGNVVSSIVDRSWDYRRLAKIQCSNLNIHSPIKWKKDGREYYYKLV